MIIQLAIETTTEEYYSPRFRYFVSCNQFVFNEQAEVSIIGKRTKKCYHCWVSTCSTCRLFQRTNVKNLEMIAKFSVLALLIFALPARGIVTQDEMDRAQFGEWKENFKKKYASSADEKKASSNLLSHKREIDAHNIRFRAGKETYSRGLWENSDLSFEEQQKLLAASKFNASQVKMQGLKKQLRSDLNQVNWVKEGLVSPVQNQGRCGACFAFAAVGVADSVLLKKGINTRLSVQEIVDCDKRNEGCEGLLPGSLRTIEWLKHFLILGGDPLVALQYIKMKGIASAESYPFSGR